MRILLVIPTHLYQFEWPAFVSLPDLPIGLAYLASTLKAEGHEVIPVNLNNRPEPKSARAMVRLVLEVAIQFFQPDVICTGGISSDYPCLKEIIRVARLNSDAPIILGGRIVTQDSQWIMHALHPDFGVIGEGEYVLPRLLASEPKNSIPNLLYWCNEELIETKQDFGYPALDELPLPDFSIFGEWMRYAPAMRYLYTYPQENPRPMVLVAGRSCPFRCSFCVHSTPIPYRARSIGNIMAELDRNMGFYEWNSLVILDELFATKKERLAEFSQAIIDRRWEVSFNFQTHSSSQLDRATLALAKRAGCSFFSYGMESASPAVLESMNKHSTPDRIKDGLDAARQSGVGFGGNFIFGDPAETPETASQTLSFFHRHCQDQHVYMAAIQPYPGSSIFERCLIMRIIKSRCSYYALMDLRRYNMTRMPSIFWLPWMAIVGFLAGKGSWLKQMKPFWESVTFQHGMKITKFRVTCPHCQRQTYHIEAEPSRHGAKRHIGTRWVPSLKAPWTISILLFVCRFLGLSLPWYREIHRLVKSPIPRHSSRSACSHCNLAFVIEKP